MKITTLENRVKKLNEKHKDTRFYVAHLHSTGQLTLNGYESEPEREITPEQYIELTENNQMLLIVSVAGMSREQALNLPKRKDDTLESLKGLIDYVKNNQGNINYDR